MAGRYVTHYRLETRAKQSDGKPVVHFVRVNGKALDRITFGEGFLEGRVFERVEGERTQGGWIVMREI